MELDACEDYVVRVLAGDIPDPRAHATTTASREAPASDIAELRVAPPRGDAGDAPAAAEAEPPSGAGAEDESAEVELPGAGDAAGAGETEVVGVGSLVQVDTAPGGEELLGGVVKETDGMEALAGAGEALGVCETEVDGEGSPVDVDAATDVGVLQGDRVADHLALYRRLFMRLPIYAWGTAPIVDILMREVRRARLDGVGLDRPEPVLLPSTAPTWTLFYWMRDSLRPFLVSCQDPLVAGLPETSVGLPGGWGRELWAAGVAEWVDLAPLEV